jgi:PEP-CTERM motif
MDRARHISWAFVVAMVSLWLACSAKGQGTFVYDQQSATESSGGGLAIAIQPNQPIGQSFTPSLDGVGFIRLSVGDTSFNGIGARIHVNLLANSITGLVLAARSPVTMPDGYHGYTDFFFPSTIPVTPGTTYYFQPVVETGDTWTVTYYNWLYSGGNAFVQGAPDRFDNLWFREGIIVPEPSIAGLLLLGAGMFAYARRKQNGSCSSHLPGFSPRRTPGSHSRHRSVTPQGEWPRSFELLSWGDDIA